MSRPRIVIVDDHAIARAGTRALLRDRVEVVGEAPNVAEAIDVIRDTEPDLVLLDLRMPGGGGAAVMEAVAPLGVRVLVVSASSRRSDVRDLVRAGAVGYLTKGVREDEFADQVVAAASGQAVFSREFAAWLSEVVAAGSARDPDLAGLTARELEVVAHVAEGDANKEIARAAGISVKTVEAHMASIFSKLGASNRREVMNWARERGMDDDERPELTDRQRQVLSFIARGLRNVEIATRLGTTTAEVEAEVRAILEAVQALDHR